jgi:hypothetical protein
MGLFNTGTSSDLGGRRKGLKCGNEIVERRLHNITPQHSRDTDIREQRERERNVKGD